MKLTISLSHLPKHRSANKISPVFSCLHGSKSGCLLAAGGGDGVAINQSWAGGLVRARAWRWPLLLYPVPGTHTHNTPQ